MSGVKLSREDQVVKVIRNSKLLSIAMQLGRSEATVVCCRQKSLSLLRFQSSSLVNQFTWIIILVEIASTTAVNIKVVVVWVMAVSGLVKNVPMFQKILLHRGRCNIFMIESAGTSETSLYFYKATRCYIAGDNNLHLLRLFLASLH